MEQIDMFPQENESLASLRERTKNYLISQKQTSFNEFWNLYEKKVARLAAERAWLKLSFREIEKVFDVVRNYVLSTPDEKFRCHASTWLNQKRFNDEIIIPKTKEQAQDDEFMNVIQSRLNKNR